MVGGGQVRGVSIAEDEKKEAEEIPDQGCKEEKHPAQSISPAQEAQTTYPSLLKFKRNHLGKQTLEATSPSRKGRLRVKPRSCLRFLSLAEEDLVEGNPICTREGLHKIPRSEVRNLRNQELEE